jgi:hypothetical protein
MRVCALALAAIILLAPSRAHAETHRFAPTVYYNDIANVVDPNFTVVAKIRKSMVPRR